MNEYRSSLPPRPPRMLKLEINEKGYPIPYFVKYIDGKPDFRIMDQEKLMRCVKQKVCWICGEQLGKHIVFNVGPISVMLGNSAEPPSHLECAEYAAQACPFLTLPKAKYREAGMPVVVDDPTGIKTNPGVAGLYVTTNYQVYQNGESILFRLAQPTNVIWYAEGKPATRLQLEEAYKQGIPEVVKRAADAEAAQLARRLPKEKMAGIEDSVAELCSRLGQHQTEQMLDVIRLRWFPKE